VKRYIPALLSALIITGTCRAAGVVFYDPLHPQVANRCTTWIPTHCDSRAHDGQPDRLVWVSPQNSVNPLIAPWPEGVAVSDAKVIDTDADTILDTVVEMSAAEKQLIADAEATAAAAALRAARLAQADQETLSNTAINQTMRVAFKIIMAENRQIKTQLNTLLAPEDQLPIYTFPQLVARARQMIAAGDGEHE